MTHDQPKEWRHIAEQASKKTDPEKLQELVDELGSALEHKKSFCAAEIVRFDDTALIAPALHDVFLDCGEVAKVVIARLKLCVFFSSLRGQLHSHHV